MGSPTKSLTTNSLTSRQPRGMAAAQLTAGGVGIEAAAGAHAYGDVTPLQQLAKILHRPGGGSLEALLSDRVVGDQVYMALEAAQ
jgi:hypothetical protein